MKKIIIWPGMPKKDLPTPLKIIEFVTEYFGGTTAIRIYKNGIAVIQRDSEVVNLFYKLDMKKKQIVSIDWPAESEAINKCLKDAGVF